MSKGNGHGDKPQNTPLPFPQRPRAQTSDTQIPQFEIQRIYLKNLNYRAPMSPGIFQEELKPIIDTQVQTNASQTQANLFEVLLKVTVMGKLQERYIFTVEVEQAGLFLIKNIAPDQLPPLLGAVCPNILFPYAREAITELATRGTFPAIYLAPINFEQVYAHNLKPS